MTAAAGAAAGFTCPMHPEVRSTSPESCPECGMALEPVAPTRDAEESPELRDMTRRLRVSLLLTLPVFAIAMGEMLPGRGLHAWLSPRVLAFVQLVLATPVVLWGGLPFFQRGAASLVSRRFNMFTLIALGTGAAYGASLAAALAPGLFPAAFRAADGSVPVYFEAAAVIVTLVLLGQVLELRARQRTGSAIRALLDLAPPSARRLRDDGGEEDVPLDAVAVGDRLRLRPGERVPVDGVVLEGASAVDESMVTGESLPVARGAGDPLVGGTLNGNGALVMRAERIGDDTLLARIVGLVSEAQRTRAPIQRAADVAASWFVPAVVLVAAASFVAWGVLGPEPRMAHALLAAVAVLIVACPCALGLATPMSVMVAVGRGAADGVLFRDAAALEVLSRVDTLVVDKTGTLTEGRPRLAAVRALPGRSEEELLRLAAGLERRSEHPLAGALLEGAAERGVEVPEPASFVHEPGRGVRGRVDGADVRVGNAALLADAGVATDALDADAAALREDGGTVAYVAVDGALAGLVGIVDPVKESTPDAVAALRREGLDLVVASGDHPRTAEAVARRLGLARVVAGVGPEEKAALVATLQDEGHAVAMAGDGVNDAPALARAEVGIAMGSGADVALESAGVTLVRGDLRAIARARRLSRATLANIRENLFFAFAYNALGVPIAAGVLYPVTGMLLSPMLAAAAMSLSSVSVIGNALRLRRRSI